MESFNAELLFFRLYARKTDSDTQSCTVALSLLFFGLSVFCFGAGRNNSVCFKIPVEIMPISFFADFPAFRQIYIVFRILAVSAKISVYGSPMRIIDKLGKNTS